MKFPRIVYALKHDATGKIYVGSTDDLATRIYIHLSALRRGDHGNLNMQADFNQFGGGYTVYSLGVVRKYENHDLEYLWMDALGSRDPDKGYNHVDKSKPCSLKKKTSIYTSMDQESIRNVKHALDRMGKDFLRDLEDLPRGAL